ncbi:unnamed protein product [Tuber aestivum]|uniref:Uncharacterized protein n=1 Tax=Tuber aestivum TaxID=59557 RepID=A0A292Q6Y9_9PEZI|nr:unnamed protein product [Tuber aestivum]
MLYSVRSLPLYRTAFHHVAHRSLHTTPLVLKVNRGMHTAQPTANQLRDKVRQCIDNLRTIETGLSQMPAKPQARRSYSPEEYRDYCFGRTKEPPPGMCPHLVELIEYRNGMLSSSQEKMLVYGDYTPIGALIHMVYSARLHKTIPDCIGLQEELDALASQEEFVSALREEARARGLVAEEVCDAVHGLFDAVSEETRIPSSEIVVEAGKYTPNQVAALVAILKAQAKWPSPLEWREQPSDH